MPRKPRVEIPGGLYHVVTRGVRRHPIFLDTSDRKYFLQLLAQVRGRFGWQIHSYCQMTNHYHLLIEIRDQLSAGMHVLNGEFAAWSNKRHGTVGHVFERRFFAEHVKTDAHALDVARYVALNPVRAGICDHPIEWPWSSFRAVVGRAPVPDFLTTRWVLGMFGGHRERAQRQFADFVAMAITVDAVVAS